MVDAYFLEPTSARMLLDTHDRIAYLTDLGGENSYIGRTEPGRFRTGE